MFSPAELFYKELCELPAVLTEIKNFLDSRGANMRQHSSKRIMTTVANNICEDQEDCHAAVDILTEILAAGRRVRADISQTDNNSHETPQATTRQAPSTSAPDIGAQNVVMRLTERDKKLSRELGETWMDFVAEYMQVCGDYAPSTTQKLHYMHKLLHGDAIRFYLNHMDGYAASFQQSIDLVEKEYNSAVRHARVKSFLNIPRIPAFESEGLDEAAALSRLKR